MHQAIQRLNSLESLLISVAGRIMQQSDRKAKAALGAATNALVGAGVVSSVMGTAAAFGNASTGTAIASLYGAAKSTATLFWIGGLVGGGVAAGTAVVGAGALGAGLYGSHHVRKAILGNARDRCALSEVELSIVEATHALVASIEKVKVENSELSDKVIHLFVRVGVEPLLDKIDQAFLNHEFDSLKTYNRARLRGHSINLRKAAMKLIEK